METWVSEIGLAVVRFLLHPVLYVFILANLAAGRLRVLRERKDFHTKVYPMLYELRTSWAAGLGLGVLLSAVMIGAGVVLSTASLLVIAAWTVLFALLQQFRYISPAYSVGMAAVLFLFAPDWKTGTVLDTWLADGTETNVTALTVALGLLLAGEGLLIAGRGARTTTPQLWKGKRGLAIGAHVAKRFWFVPVLVPVPGTMMVQFFDWWPVLPIGADGISLFLVPFGIGFARSVRGMLPREAIVYTGRRVFGLGLLVLALAVGSYWLPGLAVGAAGIAMLGRFTITVQERLQDDKLPAYFTAKNVGLMVLDVLPNSPATELKLQPGEIITKVNGIIPTSLREFYQALQHNTAGAFCKLEVLDTNNELRLVQRALYAGEHHELGIVFVEREYELDTEAM